MPVALIDAAKTDSALHIAYDKLIRVGARRVLTSSQASTSVDDASPPPPTAIDDDEHTLLVVDVITDSPASPSGDDASPPPPPTAIDDDEHTPLVVDVITDSPASPSGAVDDDIKPVDLTSMRDQDAADDERVMREAYNDENISEDDDDLL